MKEKSMLSLKDVVVQPMFKADGFLPVLKNHTSDSTINETWYPKNRDNLLVIRDYQLIELMNELSHILTDTSVCTRSYQGNYLDMPVIDLDAMMEYLCSDLDKMIVGESHPNQFVHRYLLTEILDHDAEITPLLEGVMTLVKSIFQILSKTILEHPVDHHAPHRYELQQILPSGGVVLRRIDL